MHKSVGKFIKDVRRRYPKRFFSCDVLEVGSHDINGSPRKYFWFCNYTGVDISSGKGVDIVGRLCDVEERLNEQYRTVISTECLEHDETWPETLWIMYNRLQPGGLFIMTCAGPDRREHGTRRSEPNCSPDTTDYYMNITRENFKSILNPDMFRSGDYYLNYANGYSDLHFWGIKAIDAISPNAV